MAKLEKEVKILDINIDEIMEQLKMLGANFKGKKYQKIYVYDIPTIYHRFLEALELLKSDNELVVTSNIKRLSIIFDEFSDLISDDELRQIYADMNINDFNELLAMNKNNIIMKLKDSKLLNEKISNKLINPNKWVRLRKSNDKIELTLKHIYEKDAHDIQKVKEYEINVSDLSETNLLLNEMGIVNRNYQEKIRYSFVYKTAEIELDEWPLLEPYMEIECDNEKVIEEIIESLNLHNKEIVSLNTEQLYKRKGIDILKISDMSF